jgi:hypothetical protein
MSFGYLLLRTVAVALYAASIYDESRAAKEVLYAVPTHSYQVEVSQSLSFTQCHCSQLDTTSPLAVQDFLILFLQGTVPICGNTSGEA